MRVGFVGLGKLGFPVALAAEARGHQVLGSDPSPQVEETIRTRVYPHQEDKVQSYLKTSQIELCSVEELVDWAEIVMVTIQTPHEPQYEGVTPVPATRKDFDYHYLAHGLEQIDLAARKLDKDTTAVVVSTCLPGTYRERFEGRFHRTELVYNPSFIAMGTTMADFLHPEFVLMGTKDRMENDRLEEFYATIFSHHFRHPPKMLTDITTAELIKVAYNTYIGQKIVFANTMMEISHKIGANVDDVTRAMAMANRRLISSAYLSGGMGDGGGCHPRDNIAMSWLASRLHLSYDWFDAIMQARESQTEWLARLATQAAKDTRPIVVVGEAYKPGTNLTVGSPAHLLLYYLHQKPLSVTLWDPHTIEEPFPSEPGAVYVIATKHPEFYRLEFPPDATVIDPWGYIPDRPGVDVIRIGRP